MTTLSEMENYIGHHPYIGFTISIIHFAAGISMKLLIVTPSDSVLKWAQLGAFVVGMIAGGFTIYGVWKTHHGKRGKK